MAGSIMYWFSGNCVNKKVMQVTTPSIEVIELLTKLSLNLFSSLSSSWLCGKPERLYSTIHVAFTEREKSAWTRSQCYSMISPSMKQTLKNTCFFAKHFHWDRSVMCVVHIWYFEIHERICCTTFEFKK